jgi:thiamine pyrophosphate-dependent acetolactate synthase large subunit-like protein
MTKRAAPNHAGLHPEHVLELMNATIPPEALVYCDIGNVTAWVVRHLKRTLPRTFFTDTVSGSMDYAIPAAIGGKLGRPEVPVYAIVGDGGALMGSILDVFTAVELASPITVVIFNDGGWGMLEHGIEQSPFCGAPRPSFRFGRRVDFAALARSLHAVGRRIRSLGELSRALRASLAPSLPLVLDVAIDPAAVPPIGGRTAHVNRHMSAEDA